MLGAYGGLGRSYCAIVEVGAVSWDRLTSIADTRSAADRKQVDDFHAAAIKAGGEDNGAPGIRKQYHPGYYGAFVIDPAGHNIEAVIHERVEGEGGREKTVENKGI